MFQDPLQLAARVCCWNLL